MNYMDDLLVKLQKICGYPEQTESAGYKLTRNKDGSGDVQCMNCGCIHRIDGDRKQELNEKQFRCKACGAVLRKWVREAA